jgi:hypothetical protein
MKESPLQFTAQQKKVFDSGFTERVIVSGPAGCGKTSAGVEYLRRMVKAGIPADSILVLTPQRSLARPYRQLATAADFPANGSVSVLTLGGLAQRMISLFWPMVAQIAGFKNPLRPPQFLTLETSQYYIARVMAPLLQRGYFDAVTIEPNRIYSQILDNMNKAAVVGFDVDEIGRRLTAAWSGSPKQTIIYEQVQDCASEFRKYCLENNLLDFSLQFAIFCKHLWPSLLCKSYLKNSYTHLIYDNLEEDIPTAHDILREWLPDLKSALLIQDTDAGFRTFLGADKISAETLGSFCENKIELTASFVKTTQMQTLENSLSYAIRDHHALAVDTEVIKSSCTITSYRFFPQALDGIVASIDKLVKQVNVDPSQIVVLTPFLSDSLRFTLTRRFEEAGIPWFTFRPSRSLCEEPPVSALLTLAKVAHPQWGFTPTRHDLRYMLMQFIPEIDLVRADLVAQILYSPNRAEDGLVSFAQVRPEMQQRITFLVGEKYETLRGWLERYRDGKPADLDVFFAQAFGELLSQRGFSFHEDFYAASLISRLVESARKFRQVISSDIVTNTASLAQEYIRVVEEGLIAAQYLSNWDEQTQNPGVLIAPAYTYLMSNRPVQYQFWLDIGSNGWWSRLDQPLTQPYVLSRNWPENQQWTAYNDLLTQQATLERVVVGLLRRCGQHVTLVSVGMNESGSEERGALLVATQTMLRGLTATGGQHV